jgi:hypothetical protein
MKDVVVVNYVLGDAPTQILYVVYIVIFQNTYNVQYFYLLQRRRRSPKEVVRQSV